MRKNNMALIKKGSPHILAGFGSITGDMRGIIPFVLHLR